MRLHAFFVEREGAAIAGDPRPGRMWERRRDGSPGQLALTKEPFDAQDPQQSREHAGLPWSSHDDRKGAAAAALEPHS